MKKSWLPVAAVCAIVLAVGVYVLSGEDDSAAGSAIVAVTMPSGLSEVAQLGQNAFNGVCADCHGENGAGREGMGPPLIHKIYEPSHHGDMSFLLAVQNGVRSHHWRFLFTNYRGCPNPHPSRGR